MKQSCFFFVVLAAASARGDVLFNNFGPNNAHLGNTGWSVAFGGPFGVHLEEAVSFTPSGGDYFFNSAEIAIGHLFGPNILHARLHADASGSPGTILESITVNEQMLPFPNEPHINNPPVLLPFSGSALLQDGIRYWLSVSSITGQDAWLAWNYNTTQDLGQRAFRENGGMWNVHAGSDPRGAFRIHGTPIPAPAALAILGLGLTPRRRRP